ncbi:FCD domain-containing protein [Streptomyces sp. NBC_01016]|uniref:FadR/GntR family transcriptional regulator n=1 Tax=Streptomyces sp. NBC_01016 TaxID=2903720 RepID=UPI00225C1878|nr:FCD domain-containing protein [Streptomyces sp. NBC_01016]MCX4831354.1 FCD domain-containing protein [Streptomyces sp. NBC_01016]
MTVGKPFAVVSVPKAADVLAAEIRERILSGELPEGSILPTERELVEQTGLSRATVREALRILQVERLLRIRPGRGGGAFVHHPDHASLAGAVELVIRGQHLRLDALHETREAVEPACAALAAARRTEVDLAQLGAAHDALMKAGDVPRFLRANVRWHTAVAHASGNELLIGLMTALADAIYAATDIEHFLDNDIRRVTARAHARVTESIRAGDQAGAKRRMERHVCAFARAAGRVDQREGVELEG